MNEAERIILDNYMDYSVEELDLVFNRIGLGMYGDVSEACLLLVRDRRNTLKA